MKILRNVPFQTRVPHIWVTQLNHLPGWPHISLPIFTPDAKGPCLGKPPLHLDLMPDIWVKYGTQFDLTRPSIFRVAQQFLFL